MDLTTILLTNNCPDSGYQIRLHCWHRSRTHHVG